MTQGDLFPPKPEPEHMHQMVWCLCGAQYCQICERSAHQAHLARTADPDTSKQAGRDIMDGIGSIQMDVLRWFADVKRGTDEAMEEFFKSHYMASTVRTRRRELVVKGLLRDSGKRVTNDRGKNVIVWELV